MQAGSLSKECVAESGQCECKKFVEGVSCDTCKTGYDILSEKNPVGCSGGSINADKMNCFILSLCDSARGTASSYGCADCSPFRVGFLATPIS